MNNVFIPSRGRWSSAAKLAEVWREHDFVPHFVVEPGEFDMYATCLHYHPAKLRPLPIANMGIGHSRKHCLELAASYGYKSIILADDDIKPGKLGKANMDWLVDAATNLKVLGITARYSYHDLCLGDKIKERDDIILLPTGTFRLVSLNVDNVLSIGNYDQRLEYAEDCDLLLRGLEAGYPWMVHLGTWANSIGGRYQPGGMLDFAGGSVALKDKKEHWHNELYCKWPRFVNDPTKADFTKQNSIRISWRKAYDQLLPGWKYYSALHGGHLASYFNIKTPVTWYGGASS